MALTPEQRRVLATIKQVAAAKGASPKQVKAAIETGLVESGLTNPSGGDADSAGWRQERAGLYKDPTNLRASVERFFNETSAVKDKYGRAGDLAAAVQRPAAQFRGRYQQQSGRADQLLGGAQGGAGGQGAAGSTVRSSTTTTPGVDNSSSRAAAIAAFLGSKGSDPLDFALQIKGLQDTPGTSVTRTTRTGGSAGGAGDPASGSLQSKLISRANSLDKRNNAGKLPYAWGGGHAAKTSAYSGTPVDCSGAVSSVLGINPKVSGQFETFGKPGEGGTATIYANSHHVLMKVRGRDGAWHFFGTSGSNPGGGAGWIPAKNISQDYLRGFTARHI